MPFSLLGIVCGDQGRMGTAHHLLLALLCICWAPAAPLTAFPRCSAKTPVCADPTFSYTHPITAPVAPSCLRGVAHGCAVPDVGRTSWPEQEFLAVPSLPSALLSTNVQHPLRCHHHSQLRRHWGTLGRVGAL